jgi:hypothetical protein
MPDYRPGAPSVDLFTPDEHLVLCDWFGVDCPRSGRWIWEVLDEWNIPEEVYRHERTGAAVAQILLERIQDRLPDCASPTGSARPVFDRRAHRKVELWPRHILTINWADSAPGVSWPVAYKATYVPGFDRTVVTASADCTEIFGVCDVAIGAFGPEVSILQGSRDIIVSDWSWQRAEWDQQRWVYLFDTGLVSEAEARTWADEVWTDHPGDPQAVQSIDRGSRE